MFQGVTTAILTPFQENNAIDFYSLEKILTFQIKSEVDYILLGGSTGEGNNLSQEEYVSLVNNALDIVDGKKPLIANISSSNYQYSLQLLKIFNSTSLQGIISTAPYYSLPSQEGIFYYFQEIDRLSHKPIMVYNNFKRTSVEIGDNLLVNLTNLKNICAIKDSSNDYEKPTRITKLLSKSSKNKLEFICGDDTAMLSYHIWGGNGIVSVLSNVFPDSICDIWNLLNVQNYNKAKFEYLKIIPLLDKMKLATNPVVIKYIAYLQKLIQQDKVRLPLLELDQYTKSLVQNVVQEFVNINYETDITK